MFILWKWIGADGGKNQGGVRGRSDGKQCRDKFHGIYADGFGKCSMFSLCGCFFPFSDGLFLSGSGRRCLDAYGTAWRKGEWSMGENAEKEAAISTVCASGVDLDADSISWMKREVSASYTVEVSFVMAVAFFFIAALLNGVFEVHGRITGRFVLQEAMERCLYREEKTLRGDGMTVGEISSRAGQRLRGFFRCGDAVLTIREDGGDLDGRVKSSTETEISLRGQEPERAIRLLTVLENAE